MIMKKHYRALVRVCAAALPVAAAALVIELSLLAFVPASRFADAADASWLAAVVVVCAVAVSGKRAGRGVKNG